MKMYRVTWTHPTEGGLCEAFRATQKEARDEVRKLNTDFAKARDAYDRACRKADPELTAKRPNALELTYKVDVPHPGFDPDARLERIDVPTDLNGLVAWLNRSFSWS